jgi:hypothetical protein
VKVVKVAKKEPKENIVELIRELRTISLEKSELDKREKKIKEKLNPLLDKQIPPDAKGHRFYQTTDAFGNSLIIKREARKSLSIIEAKCRDYLTKDPELLSRVFVTMEVEKMDEDELENLVAEGELTVEDVQCFTDTKINYATVFVKETESEE